MISGCCYVPRYTLLNMIYVLKKENENMNNIKRQQKYNHCQCYNYVVLEKQTYFNLAINLTIIIL